MIAALTLLFLLAASMMVVRIGSSALRLTGMSQTIARFQALSAFSGTGFTTSEAEEMMHHPTRRKILVLLMVIGSLGVVTVLSTVILGLVNSKSGSDFMTIIYMAMAVMAICFLAVSKRLDETMCTFVEKGFMRLGWVDETNYLVLAELPNGDQLVEHSYLGLAAMPLEKLRACFPSLTLLQVNDVPEEATSSLSPQDRMLCFAHRTVHREVSNWLQNL